MFNHALADKGIKILWDPSIRVHHRHRSSWSGFLLHQRGIGAATARVLKDIDLPGSWIARHPAAGLVFAPLLPAVKWVKTVAAFLRYQPSILLKRPHVLLPLAVGLLFWMRGFVRESWEKK